MIRLLSFVFVFAIASNGFSQCSSVFSSCNSSVQILQGQNAILQSHGFHQPSTVLQVPLLYSTQNTLFSQGHGGVSQSLAIEKLTQAVEQLSESQRQFQNSIQSKNRISKADYENALKLIQQYQKTQPVGQYQNQKVQSSQKSINQNAALILKNKCASCHDGSDSARLFDVNKPISALMVENIQKRVSKGGAGRMPPADELTYQEIKTILNGFPDK